MCVVDRTQRARLDLQKIWNYIAERNFPAADRTLDRIMSALNLIATQSEMGESVEKLKEGARRFSVGNYVLYYEYIEGGIRLLRAVHASRNLDNLLD